MKVIGCSDTNDLVGKSLDWLRNTVEVHDLKSIFIPAGKSPIPLYQELERIHPQFMDDLRLIQIDDLPEGQRKGMFRQFFKDQLPSYQSQIHGLDAGEVSGDATILGLGVNGHVAFHEPSLPVNFTYGKVLLSDPTCENLKIPKGSVGQTYGLGHFLATSRVLMIVSGQAKQEAFSKLIKGDLSIPASQLCQHSDFTVLYLSSELSLES